MNYSRNTAEAEQWTINTRSEEFVKYALILHAITLWWVNIYPTMKKGQIEENRAEKG